MWMVLYLIWIPFGWGSKSIVVIFTPGDSGVTARGRVPPPDTSHQEISGDLPWKERQGKKEEKKTEKRTKIEKGKKGQVENWKWKEEKIQNEERIFIYLFIFFFAFHF